MTAPRGPLKAFMAELQRRRVTRTLIAYGFVAFVVMQVSELVVPGLGLPDWVFRAVIIAALAGFPVAAVLSWAFDVGPAGVTAVVDGAARDVPAGGAPPWARGATLRFAVAVVVIAVTTFTGWRIFQGTLAMEPPGVEATPDRPAPADMLAILPFENLSAAPDDSYFADGLHDEVVTQFTKQATVGVVARQDVRRYKGSELALADICAELGCRYVLSGSVQRAGTAVIVRMSLVDSGNGSALWGESFESDLRDVAGVFAVQRQVAEHVVGALGLQLSQEEGERIADVPTTNGDAYDAYLRGRVAVEAGTAAGGVDRAEHWRRARDRFREAVEQDPSFALAWAELGMQNLRLYWWNFAPAAESVAEADEAIRRATELDPDLPQLRLTRAQRYLWVDLDPGPALAEARVALQDVPGEAWAKLMVAGAERRMGNLDEAARLLNALIPEGSRPGTAGELLATRRAQRRWKDVWATHEVLEERGSPFSADWVRIYLELQETGDTSAVRPALERMVETYGEGAFAGGGYEFWVMLRKYRKAMEILEQWETDRFHRQWGFDAMASHRAKLYAFLGMPDSAAYHAEEAVRIYEKEADAFVLRGSWHTAIAPDLARLGRREEALAHADSAASFFERDLWLRDSHREARMRVLVILGDYEEALDEIEYLLGAEYFVSLTAGELRWDPLFDPLREYPRFQTLTGPPDQP